MESFLNIINFLFSDMAAVIIDWKQKQIENKMEVRIEIGKCRNFKMEKKNGAKQDETETPEIFICSGGAWHDVPFELERMQPPVHELSGDSRER